MILEENEKKIFEMIELQKCGLRKSEIKATNMSHGLAIRMLSVFQKFNLETRYFRNK